jgi:hypothetical protein
LVAVGPAAAEPKVETWLTASTKDAQALQRVPCGTGRYSAQAARKRLAVARKLALQPGSFKSVDDIVDHCLLARDKLSSVQSSVVAHSILERPFEMVNA